MAANALESFADTCEADPERAAILIDPALTAGKLLQTANVPGWERQPAESGSRVLVQIGLLGVPPPVVTVQDEPE